MGIIMRFIASIAIASALTLKGGDDTDAAIQSRMASHNAALGARLLDPSRLLDRSLPGDSPPAATPRDLRPLAPVDTSLRRLFDPLSAPQGLIPADNTRNLVTEPISLPEEMLGVRLLAPLTPSGPPAGVTAPVLGPVHNVVEPIEPVGDMGNLNDAGATDASSVVPSAGASQTLLGPVVPVVNLGGNGGNSNGANGAIAGANGGSGSALSSNAAMTANIAGTGTGHSGHVDGEKCHYYDTAPTEVCCGPGYQANECRECEFISNERQSV